MLMSLLGCHGIMAADFLQKEAWEFWERLSEV